MSDLPAPSPPQTPETEQFWAATAEGRFLLPRCADCDEVFYYPRTVCPGCLGEDVEWDEASGEGEVYARTVVRQAGGSYGEVTPYVLAYVELEEGPRMMTNVVDADPESVSIGDPVELVLDETDSEAALPRFRPV